MTSCWACKLEALVSHPFRNTIQECFPIKNYIDIIELGLPFTDPIADGPTIQKSNLKALENGVTISSMLDMVRDARRNGLKTPVLFMGYYNPILQYGEDKLLTDCKEAGVNGFIVVDLPLKEAIRFRNGCTKAGYVDSARIISWSMLIVLELKPVICPFDRTFYD